jgi:UDP-N-acetylglucosamine transferase subunit ALG13
MIFLTVGTQEPFDRLVRAVDAWAATHNIPVFGQLGRLTADSYRPANFPYESFISADEFQERLEDSRLMVGHAGMGSIISALTFGKPLLMMARRASLGEHRNEHQLATAARFTGRPGIHVAGAEDEIGVLIDRLLVDDPRTPGGTQLTPHASPELIGAIRDFIHGGK